ncbi:MAG: ATP-binding protein [Gemmatimonadaceae bacterium]
MTDPVNAGAISILLVDDDEIDRLALRRALSKAGLGDIRVTEAERASEAYAEITAGTFDCAFFDVRLPDRDGVVLLRDVRAAGVRTPVIVLTGFGDEQTVLDAMKAGATDYVAKSAVSAERIGQALRSAMRLGAAERQAAAAHASQERYAAQLHGLAEAAVAVNNAAGAEEMLRVTATHACRITGSDAATVELAADMAADLALDPKASVTTIAWYSATGNEAVCNPSCGPQPDPVRVSLRGRDGNEIGEIALLPWKESAVDAVVVSQLGRLVAGVLENVRLYLAAQRATRAREDVLAVVSHDLRNPLHTIGLSVSLLEEVFPDSLSEIALQQTRIIQRAVKRANTLIQDLLDVSRIEAGGLSVVTAPLPPQQLLDDVHEAMGSLAAAADIKLECVADTDLSQVLADRERVLQVFTNLVGNAIKFTPPGGTITVSATGDGPGFVQFAVRDTGPGIAAENLPHVFDRFWQARHGANNGANNGESKSSAGAGLGLAIAKGIVVAHGGTISVSSKLGVGTEFTLLLPTVVQ